MKHIATLFIVFILSMLAFYSIACFIAWEANPAKWDSFGRGMFAFISVALSATFTGIANQELD